MTAWRVPVVDVTGGTRVESYLDVEAETPIMAWLAAQELPGAPVESDTVAYGTPVRCRELVAS